MAKTRYVAYSYTIDSENEIVGIAYKELKSEHMARNFVAYWNTLPDIIAFLCVHVFGTDTFGQTVGLQSKELDW